MNTVTVLGGGLAGCEAALWLAGQGVSVTLHEQKPLHFSPAHKAKGLAELVCSNSLKAERLESAGGLLKEEMRRMGSSLLPLAEKCRVAAGGALAVNREDFSRLATEAVAAHPLVTLRHEICEAIPAGVVIVATGPLTEGPLAEDISRRTGGSSLSFYDAAAPIVTAASLDMDLVFAASRYGRGDDDYLNCPFNKEEYEAFYEALVNAEVAPKHEFDEPTPAGAGSAVSQGEASLGPKAPTVYEGCMPVEIMAKRGIDTLRFGPLRPVGLRDPRTGHRPWACLQLRKENAEGTLYNLVGFQTNLKFGEQKRVFAMIPGLARAEYARYGVMHRNTFLNSPAVLGPGFVLKGEPDVFFAGQITGFEGYTESMASGLMAARAALCRLRGTAYTAPPPDTMCGALSAYLAAPSKSFQPMGANMGLLPVLEPHIRDKRLRYAGLANRALASLAGWRYL